MRNIQRENSKRTLTNFVNRRIRLEKEVDDVVKEKQSGVKIPSRRGRYRVKNKTKLMLAYEKLYGVNIEKILTSAPQPEVAKKLGITQSCVSLWKERLGLSSIDFRYNGHNKEMVLEDVLEQQRKERSA